MGMLEVGVQVVKLVMPPKTNDLDEQQRWRWVVFCTLVSLSIGFVGHLVLECGWVPNVYPGFALASDTQAIQRRVDVIAVLSLQHEIRAKASELCKESVTFRRVELNDDIAKLEHDYQDIEKHDYPIPRCDQL